MDFYERLEVGLVIMEEWVFLVDWIRLLCVFCCKWENGKICREFDDL